MSKATVVMGVTGSIAAYKACDIISALKKQGVEVHVILTASGARFITPLALETVSGNAVVTDLFSRETPWEVEHIALAKRADVFLIAPATANVLAKAAAGMADDMLTSTLLATLAPVLVAPAMNTNMYLHPATQGNIGLLQARGVRFIAPGSGPLACGDEGVGRLADVPDIVAAVLQALAQKRDLCGKRILVSAGPTQERIDPVRYLTNRSSGKMGYAIAGAAAARGAAVTLISGATNLSPPTGVERVDVLSSADMFAAVDVRFDGCDALIMAAAPADFTPRQTAEHKIKKNGEGLQLELCATQDILAHMGARKGKQVLVGFAAETQDIAANAQGKLKNKNLDFIAANDVSGKDAGFAVDTNAVTLYSAGGGAPQQSGSMTKQALADWLLDRVFAERS
ncbi:MAG: bifunctional phosphopantothenoylcysteine decarboxylase/phosphopantothenate--cysteine ligase CoaBC [Christensenellaceae bacterium]|jgi:phosphopantothenoylcysteine decarboxylase/phosphopantothenate--cysteine ligase|nr:bifunctional phosphopantothenoylcysteine decarboxylase/phosphopantothenate--cysteine ligase CoaBC [Christensenellaceae bacterium]